MRLARRRIPPSGCITSIVGAPASGGNPSIGGAVGVLQIELVADPDDVNLEDRLGKLDEDRQIVRDVGPRILRHVAKEVKHEQFYHLDVLTVTVDTRALA